MFPNPQDALPLPPRSNLEQYKKLAKSLLKACKSKPTNPNAIDDWAERWVSRLVKASGLKFQHSMPVRVSHWVSGVAEFIERHMIASTKGGGSAPAQTRVSNLAKTGGKAKQPPRTACSLSGAQFVI